jgi:TRAP-type C4-dicarboxylate transport system permease small subunit
LFNKYHKLVVTASNWFGHIGAALLLAIPVITFFDIVGSKFFSLPVPGSVELTGFLQSMLFPFAAALTLVCGQHIKVEVFTDWLPGSVKEVMDGIISLILFCLSIVLIWQTTVFGISIQSAGEYSGTLHIPLQYIIYLMAIGFVPLALGFLEGFLKLFRGNAT